MFGKDSEYYFLLVKEHNPLFTNKQISEYSISILLLVV